jgi:hypothetical protein
METLGRVVANDPIQLGTLLSICSGIALAVIGFVRTRLQDRKRYTLGVLMGYSQSTELLKALHALREHAALSRAAGQCKVDAGLEEHLAVVLPHFQSIALAAKSGLLDRDIILSARYGSMQSIWESYGPYIEGKRRAFNRPLLYAELEEFLNENAGRYRRYQRRFTARRAHAPPAATG